MNNNQYTYNQPPMGQVMPPPQMGAPRANGWRERMMHRFGMDTTARMPRAKELTIPNWITGKTIAFFFVAMFLCWFVFGYVPGFDLWIVAAISVVLFFYGGMAMSKGWSHDGEKNFIRNVFVAGFVIRLIWILYCYFVFNPEHFGNTFGETADVEWYMPFAKALALFFSGESEHTLFQILYEDYGAAMDDIGYPLWLGLGYALWGESSDVFMPMLIKCIVSAYCAICVYHVAKRHYGEGTARMAAIFVCVNPNIIYWCGTMFKEAEMVFLCCLAVDNFDRVLSSGKKYTFKTLLPGVLAGMALMFFRSALGLVFFLAVFAHVVMASHRVMSIGKKIIAGVLVAGILVFSMGDRLQSHAEQLVERVNTDDQELNMQWRGKREGGNEFAKYAGAAVFAPLIFTIPFPTFNQANEMQLRQVQLSGGSYIKNIFSFFVILVMIMMLVSGEWRKHVFVLAYTIGYLAVLVMSPFAQSGRFHMPIWPMLMLFSAYGIQLAKGNAKMKRWFSIALVIEVVACLAWNWFKLAGRGML